MLRVGGLVYTVSDVKEVRLVTCNRGYITMLLDSVGYMTILGKLGSRLLNDDNIFTVIIITPTLISPATLSSREGVRSPHTVAPRTQRSHDM